MKKAERANLIMKAIFMNVSPLQAMVFLEQNTNNYRKPDQRRVDLYARQMAAGLWNNNAEPIHFADDGTLINGQHRLLAVIKSGATVPMLVVYGVNKNALFDVGGVRTTQQILRANGLKISTQESCAIGIIRIGFSTRYGAEEIKDFYCSMPDFVNVSNAIIKGAKHPVTQKGGVIAAAYCSYVLNNITVDDIEQFAIVCNTGIPSQNSTGYAPLCFRRTLQDGIKNTNGETITGGSSFRQVVFETAYRALNDFKQGIKRTRNYKPDGTGSQIINSVRKMKGWG